MTSPFASGNKDLISQARRNPILEGDDLVPSYMQQISDAFDKTYYEAGIGIQKDNKDALDEQRTNIAALGLGFNETLFLSNLYRLRANGFSEERIDERFAPQDKARLDSILAANSDTIIPPEELRSITKSRINGEVQRAEKRLSKGDDITAKLIGGIGGISTNPAIIASLFVPLGQEFAIAKTGSTIAKILKSGLIEGGVGALAEAGTIGTQKENAVFLGKNFDNWDAARNIALAGGGGFIFGSLIKSGGSAFDYIKGVRKGVDDAEEIIFNKIDVATGDKEAVRYMDDFAYTGERALSGDEFAPLHGKDITNEEYFEHINNAQRAYDEGAEWGVVAENKVYREKLPKPSKDTPKNIDDESLYSEFLTEADRAFDQKLFKDAAKIDVDLPVATRTGEEGETIIDTKNSRTLFKELDGELNGLQKIAVCMRGGK